MLGRMTTLALLILFATCGWAQETVTKKESWVTITNPKQIKFDKTFEVKLKLANDIPAGMKLCTDIHWMKPKGQYGGFMSSGGGAKDAVAGKTYTYSFKAKSKQGLATVHVFTYLSKDGKFGNAAKKTTGQAMQVDATPTASDLAKKKVTYKKSWIYIDYPRKDYVSGDDWPVTVEYYLDPEDDWGGTKLALMVVGPWIDCPDGKYTKKRHHITYPGGYSEVAITPGHGKHVFRKKIPSPKERNSLLCISFFKGADGKNWPWQTRCGGPMFKRSKGFFELETDVPANLFTYAEKPVVNLRLISNSSRGESKKVDYKIYDTDGTVVSSGSQSFKVTNNGQKVPLTLDLAKRGTFLIEATVDGWEKRSTTFCRIPDLMKITKGAPTRFGMTNALGNDETCKAARRLGLTTCRQFFTWESVEPGPDVWKFDHWDKSIANANNNGIDTILAIVGPPAWVLECPARDIGYEPYPFKEDAFRNAIATMTKRWKGKFIGWEWQNEILPGSASPDPVADYVKFCKIGTETAKAIDPKLITTLAGGLWPHDFRVAVLNAGVAKYIDALPVHYNNSAGIEEAYTDLQSVGAKNVVVWDNETAKGLTIWGTPPVEAVQNRSMSNWVLTNWPDELSAGCRKIIYFGGQGDPCGNWTYLMDDFSPRPVAATLAVFTSKLFAAKPLGKFSIGDEDIFHLFERNGNPIMVASSYRKGGESIKLAIGSDSALMTDYQGNEKKVSGSNGTVKLGLEGLRCFIEGGDLDVLKAYVVPSIVQSSGSNKRGKLIRRPSFAMLTGQPGKFFVNIQNLYDRGLDGSISLDVPSGWTAAAPVKFSVAKGKAQMCTVPVAFPDGVKPGSFDLKVVVKYDTKKLPTITKPIVVNVISPESLGNLIKNGDFEQGAGKPDSWNLYGKGMSLNPAETNNLGIGKQYLHFQGNNDWTSFGQSMKLTPGQTYLYTAWVWNKNLGGGSNINQTLTNGKQKNLYNVHVFDIGKSSPYWRMLTCVYNAPADLKSVAFTPVTRGGGWGKYDNIRLTNYEGTRFAGECLATKNTIKVDGNLSDWQQKAPIPLIGDNQLTKFNSGYKWTPDNLNGVAYLRWNEKYLYLAVEVLDDKHVANQTGDDTIKSDSVVLAIHPLNRVPGQDQAAFAYYLSTAKPGGGSGKYTLYRPADKSAGKKSGQLAKDSSVYDIAIVHRNGKTVYEIALPWNELGMSPAIGIKFGLSLQLNDNDGQGRAAAMSWGEGLQPAWAPQKFGVVTILGEQ